jgi:hypothetical protein
VLAQVQCALFMVEVLKNDELVRKATPAFVDRQTPSALAHAASD